MFLAGGDCKRFEQIWCLSVKFQVSNFVFIGSWSIYLNVDLKTSGINLHNQSACWNLMLIHTMHFESFPLPSTNPNLSIIDQRTLLFDNIQTIVNISVISET